MLEDEATRRYRVLALLGEGGFGKVYRAVMEGAGGFSKEVAIKLLHDDDFPESVRRRFRDEARILGLIRDRAIVGVDPPVQLSGLWAIVMEYVDGVSGAWLVKRGALPATVSLEILQEVARALDTVYRQAGPDGTPLRLIHRDLKPANLQITPTGAVKILDFGIARAEFGGREAKTRRHVGGTFGYIAPERLEGIDGPEGDVYALGVVLHELVCGLRPGVSQRPPTYSVDEPTRDEPPRVGAAALDVDQRVLDLSRRMRDLEPENRPTARDVERECSALLKQLDGPSLRAWAEETVPAGAPMEPDARVGSHLTEASASTPNAPTEAGSGRAAALMFSTAALLLVVALVVAALGAGALGVALYMNQETPAETPAIEPEPAQATPANPEPEPPEPTIEAPVPQPAPPEPTPDRPVPHTPAQPSPPTVPQPRPLAPAPTGPTYEVTVSSIPLGASVTIDGRAAGTTPVTEDLTAGSHVVHIEFDGRSNDHSIQVGRRTPKRYLWRSEENEWDSIY